MNAFPFNSAMAERTGRAVEELKPGAAVDTAWIVLEAANDLGDEATVTVCRRVIDAGLNGEPASAADLQTVQAYFS
jgi:hypothetical protein